MRIEGKTITLKDGRSCLLRNPTAADAEALIEYLKITAAETPYLTQYPEEISYTPEAEQEVLEKKLEAERGIMIVAEVDGKIIGNSSFGPVSEKIRSRHRCSLGIALFKAYRGLGIGSALFEQLLYEAEKCGYEQAELEVVSTNKRGIALYRKMGFEEYGRRPHGMKYKDGTYADEILMVKNL